MYNHTGRTYHFRLSGVILTIGLLVMMMLVSGSVIAAKKAPAKAVTKPEASILSKCRADLAKRLKIKEENIKLANAETTTWPNAALGMPEIGKVYAEVITPGSKLFLEADNRVYLYNTSNKVFKYGGSTYIWAYSMLYTQPMKNDPNLNGDLYQCSLLGTNSVRIASEVSDYYPQEDGIVVIKRRTSRSGHDLLFVNAEKPGKEETLYRAMDFGNTTLDKAHNRWAGFVKPGLGMAWTVMAGQLGEENSKAKSIPLPEGTWPGKIAWSADNLMILVKNGKQMAAFETNPADESPVWKPISTFSFPGQDAFVLNKSETLEIEQVDKATVEVARVWFTGDRNSVAKITDFTMQGCELVGPYAFIWGSKGSASIAYSVDISNGATVSSSVGKGSNIKPFHWSPNGCPVPKAPRME